MAEGFEVYHVTQQIRRDKLRFVQDLQLQNRATTSSLYDPSSYLLPCATPQPTTTIGVIKQESTMSLMGFGATTATSGIINASSNNNSNSSSFLDPQASLHNLQDLNHHHTTTTNHHQQSFLYSHHPQSIRLFDHHHHNQEPFNSGGGAEPLALSLSSHNTHNTNHSLELNLQRHDHQPHSIYGGGGDYCRSMVPLGPFTGYASILKGSKFLKPAQQLLEEICDVGCGIYAEKFSVDSSLMDSSPMECLSKINAFVNDDDPNNNGGDKRKKYRLISMLDEVYKRYKQYYQQIQAVVASFETVAGLSNAAPFASLDLKALSKHFRCLKSAITDQLQFASKHHMNSNRSKEDITPAGSDRGLYGQRLNSSAMVDHHLPVWRPQRGLPERAVTVLRAWLFDHFLHPYPTDTDKLMLAKQTGLSRNQVSNWFINARVRLWKPMVEEIHTLETKQVAKTLAKDDVNMTSDNLLPQSTLLPGNPPFSPQRMQLDPPSKRTRSDNLMTGDGHEEPMTLLYDNSLPRGNNVSLTLGLHQNNGPVGMSNHFPLNAARRFGLDMSGSESSNVFSSFDSQSRPFGREVIGGQLLHDFVG